MFSNDHVDHVSCLSEKQLYWGPYANVIWYSMFRVKNHHKIHRIHRITKIKMIKK